MRIVLIWFIFFTAQTLLGQEIFHHHFDIENGLPSDEVYDVVEDNEGYLWIASDMGVTRYNGYEFENFTFDSTKLDNAILKLHKDPSGNIWFISLNGFLAYYNYHTIIPFERNEELSPYISRSGLYTSFNVSKDGTIYFGVKSLGLIVIKKNRPISLIEGGEEGKPGSVYRYIDEHDEFLSYYNRITTIREFKKYSEFLFNEKTVVNFPMPERQIRPYFKSVLIGKRKWVCSFSDQVFIFDGSTVIPIYKAEKDIIYLTKGSDNKIWLGLHYGGGVVSFDLETRESKSYLQGKTVSSVFQDSQGGLWSTTTEKGLYYCNNYSNSHFFSEDSKDNNIGGSVLCNDTLFTIFSDGKILGIFNDSVFEKTHISSVKPFFWIDCVDGDLFAGNNSYDGTYKINGNTYENIKLLIDGRERSVVKMEEDTMYLRPFKWNVVKGQKDSLLNLFGSWAGSRFDCSFQDSTGIYWGNKLGLLTPANGELKNISKDYNIEGIRILKIDKDRRGRFVFATKSSGLQIASLQKKEVLSIENGLSSNNVTNVYCEYDTIWCSTRNGLNKIVFNHDKGSYSVVHHTALSNSLLSQNIKESFPLKNHIYLLTPKGLAKLHRSFFNNDRDSLRLNVFSIEINDSLVVPSQGYLLDHFQSKVQINYTAIDYKTEGEIQYFYRLIGSTENWQITHNRSIEYPTLPPGKYQFELYAQSNLKKSEMFVFNFEIQKPWWNTIWAYVLYLGGFVLVVSILIRARTEQLKSKQKELEGIVKERTVEIELQRDLAERQKRIVQEKNKEVLDSITYAKRIQAAILPSERLFDEWLKDYFIYYKPKDIVAGDFYWLEVVGSKVLFAAADCTGHGVPGALVSVVCHNALNRAVREFNLIEPAAILDKTKDLVVETFSHSDENVRDGMDISLCCIDFERKELQYAGANNALYIIREEKDEASVIKLNPDKQPVGKFAIEFPFTNHVFQLKEKDTIYSYTDGYVDQFGGEKGKKYKHKQFLELLLSLQNKPMSKQREILNNELVAWQRDFDQVDDICVIGVQV